VDAKSAIKAALERHALLDAHQIQVEANGGKVVLRGNVRSFMEREEAERAAWAAPGVVNVENRIVLII
jgi:osmotically-inducible protein OsmY